MNIDADPTQLKKAAWGFQRVDDSGGLPAGEARLLQPTPEPPDPLVHARVRRLVQHLPPRAAPHRRADPARGTSNHFRREPLEACLGWDPYNVTEDADLGLRFARLGLTTTMLESTTGEEANSQVPNWLRQRSRWSKGYMQTVLVHTRRPWTLVRELGPKATAGFLLTLGGAFVTALLAPVFWLLLLLWSSSSPIGSRRSSPDRSTTPPRSASSQATSRSCSSASARRWPRPRRPRPVRAADPLLLGADERRHLPRAVELFFRPYHWHKTEHGLHLAEEAA